jgi:excisionase family DNA binding protein
LELRGAPGSRPSLLPGLVVTLREAAERLGVTPDTLRQQIAKKKLTAVRRGRDWWVTDREVERYRESHKR